MLDLFVANGMSIRVLIYRTGAQRGRSALLLRQSGWIEIQEYRATAVAGSFVPARGAAFGPVQRRPYRCRLNNIDSPPTWCGTLSRIQSLDHLKLVGGRRARATDRAKVICYGWRRAHVGLFSGGSYASSSINAALRPRHRGESGQVEVDWPSGAKEEITIPASTFLYGEEGKGIVAP